MSRKEPLLGKDGASRLYNHVCKNINRSHTHIHTQTENDTPTPTHTHTHTHTHTTRTPPQTPKRTPPHKHLTTLQGGATTVCATSPGGFAASKSAWEVAYLIDDPFTPTKHLPPLPTIAAGPQRLTPARRHHYNEKGGYGL